MRPDETPSSSATRPMSPAPSAEPGLVGVGYEDQAIESFVAGLVASGITRVVDVRLNPVSRKPGFGRAALSQALAEHDIAYEHRPELGNPRDNREGFADSPARQAAYVMLLRAPGPARALDDLARLARRSRVALLCFEADQNRCHRRLVLSAVESGLPRRAEPADEPLESRDLALGAALAAWRDANAGTLALELRGPFDAPGMDATWLLRITGVTLEADVVLRYGPVVDFTIAIGLELYLGGDQGTTPDRLVEMLDQLSAVDRGAPIPAWLIHETRSS